MRLLQRLTAVKPSEFKALMASCAYFFLILCAYYVIRPIRDEMVIANGVDNLHWLLLATTVVLVLLAPIFGWVTTRFRTREFLSYCTLFFALHLVGFFFLFNVEDRHAWVSQSFYVWVGVFNMFIVSLFWSFMNDVFGREQVKRLFAFIAAGGTAGAICGPIITKFLVQTVGFAPLVLISATVLAASILPMLWLIQWKNDGYDDAESGHQVANKALKGSVIGGFTLIFRSPYLACICLFILLYSISVTFVQIQQASLIEATYTVPADRAELFATIDLTVNVLVLIFQVFLTSRIIKRFGFKFTLLLIPMGITIGFGLLAVAPMLAVMIGLDIFRRAGDYAIMKPARDMLFSVVSREEKYKAKNVIDTTVVRLGGTSSSWIHAGIRYIGGAGSGIALLSIALGAAWCASAVYLGRQFTAQQNKQSDLHEE